MPNGEEMPAGETDTVHLVPPHNASYWPADAANGTTACRAVKNRMTVVVGMRQTWPLEKCTGISVRY